MAYSTEDCKGVLVADQGIVDREAADSAGWKRRSKKTGPLGVERVFEHRSGLFALVAEAEAGLWVAGYGMDESCPNRKAVPAEHAGCKAEPSSKTAPEGGLAWTVCEDKDKVERAKAYIKALLEPFGDEEDRDPWNCVKPGDEVALANQFIFAPAGDAFVITPLEYWNKEACVYDQESFIEDLLPKHSDDLNGCGTWEIPWDGGHMPCAQELLRRGFTWSKPFQFFLDKCSGFDGWAVMEPLALSAEERFEIGQAAGAPKEASALRPRI